MADNPGFRPQGFGNRDLEQTWYTRPGTVLPSFVPPIIGYHQEDELEASGKDGSSVANKGLRAVANINARAGNPGWLMPSSFDLFWKDRLHIIATSTEFGSILSAQSGTFELYNSGTKLGQHVRRVDSVNSLTSGNTVFPYYLGLGQSEVYEFLVDGDGVAAFSDSYNFTFDNGVVLSHLITGSRILLLTIRPEEPFNEKWEWLTDILTKMDGSEQRISMRDIPRQSIRHNFLHDDVVTRAKLDGILATRIPNQLGLPIWRDFTTLTAPVTAGDTALTVGATTNKQFRNGTPVAIFDPATEQFEVVTIQSFTATTITLSAPLLGSWAAGLEVIPVVFTYAQPYQQQQYRLDVDGFTVNFLVLDNEETPSTAGFPTYQGDVLYADDLTFLGNTVGRQFTHKPKVVDYDLGTRYESTTRRYPEVSGLAFVAYFDDRAQYVRIRDFLHSRRGKQKRFWMSTRRVDFEIGQDITSGSNAIDTTRTGYEQLHAQGVRTHIEIEYLDGTLDRFEVTSVNNSGSFEILNLDGNLSQDWSAANVRRTSHLIRYRLDADSLDFRHDWYTHGEVRFTVREIES